MAKKNVRFVAPKPPRRRTVSILLNDAEYKAISDYCKEFKVSNRSKWIRETLMVEVIKRLEANTPLLFSDEDLR